MVASLQEAGYTDFILPYGNAAEAALAGDGACIYPARDLNEVCAHLRGEKAIKRYISSNVSNLSELTKTVDMSEVKGHEQVKRAMEIAAAGGHNMLMIGPPGSGKSMLAKRFATILPEMTLAEKLEATKIYSVAGKLKSDNPLISARPFRFPHHTASPAALIGGGINVRPGEVSFAHGGVLYLDEFAEFPKQSLDMLRQPIEDGCVTVARLSAALTYPSSFILLASMNPCPCGYYNDERHDCKCTQAMIEKYRSKISGPILDRIDIVTQVNVESYDNLSLGVESQESSAQIRQRVIGAREFALERTGGGFSGFNSRMSVSQLEKYCSLDPAEDSLLRKAFEIYAMSARSCHRVLKLARTIADLDFSEKIKCVHLTEALQYRGSDL